MRFKQIDGVDSSWDRIAQQDLPECPRTIIIINNNNIIARVLFACPKTASFFDRSHMAAARWIPPCRCGWSCWQPGCVFSHAAGQERHDHIRDLADFLAEAVGSFEEQTVGIAESSGEAGFSGPGANDSTNAAATAARKPVGEARPLGSVEHSVLTVDAATAVAGPPDEARHFGIAKHSLSTEPELAASSREAGSSWPGDRDTDDTSSAAATAVVKSAGEARPPGIAKHMATKSVLAESPCEPGDGEARPSGIAKCSATTESEHAGYPGAVRTTIAAATAVANSAEQARPSGNCGLSPGPRGPSPPRHQEDEQWIDEMAAHIMEAANKMDQRSFQEFATQLDKLAVPTRSTSTRSVNSCAVA